MTRRTLVGALLVVMAASGCVDHDLNARQFCNRHADLIVESKDERELASDHDTLGARADEIEETMKDAEDGTRPVRLAARDLLEGYIDLERMLGADDAEPDDVADTEHELREARAGIRDACAEAT
ncbi:MAG: hypothetical protein ACT4OX_04280 [Actinomycetota bacterium]